MEILATIYILLGLLFMGYMVVLILKDNILPKKHYKFMFMFPAHAAIVITCCIICAGVVHYIEHKKRYK